MSEQNEIPGVVSSNSSNGQKHYWSIINGKLSRKANQGEPGATSRTNKNNVVVWEKHEQGVRGVLKDVNVYETEFSDGKKVEQLSIKIQPIPGHFHIVNLPKESRYYNSFLEKLFAINVNQEIEIKPYNFEDKDTTKKHTGISVYQLGNKLDSYYKKKNGDKWENVNGMPVFPKDWKGLSKREQQNYFWDVDDFFKKELARWRGKYAPDYQKEKEERFDEPSRGIHPNTEHESSLSMPLEDYKDDLPF